MKNSHEKSRKILVIVSATTLVVAIVLYVYMYYSTQGLTNKALEARSSLVSEEMALVDSRNQLAVFKSTADDRAKLPGFFVPADDVVDFIQQIESIGSILGTPLTISAISADNIERSNPGTIGRVVARVTMTGSWAQAMRTLELAESLPYRSRVDKVSLITVSAPGSPSSSDEGWQLSFEVTASSLKSI